MELSVTVNRNSFNWGTEATQAIQKFFEVERQAKELFSENKLYEIIKFYTTDEVKKVYEVLCIVEKHNEEVDLKVAIFAEGEKGCHRLTFYLNDYEARKKGRAAEKKALTAIEEYIAYIRTDTKAKAC